MAIGIMLGFALVWFLFFALTNWIYDTSQERQTKNKQEFAEAAAGKGKKKIKPKEPEREIGGYKVKCGGLFWKTCHQVYNQ